MTDLEQRPRTSAWRWLRPLVILLSVGVATVAVVGGGAWLGRQVADRVGGGETVDAVDVEPGLEVEITIPPGSSAREIATILARNGVVRSATEFEVAVRASGAEADLKAGTYELLTGMENQDVIELLTRGPVGDTFRVTVREGLRVAEILDVLSEQTPHTEGAFRRALLDGSVTTALREMPAELQLSDWEGLLFPDTYEFFEDATAAQILQRLADTMQQRVESVDWSRLEESGHTLYQGIIIASLIEAEVRVADERPLVSSVIYNRLREGMRLEIDATVLYAMETRDVTGFDREIDSPYNTYRVDGLPPTPIAAPGLDSLRAAANPADTNYFFYVLSDPDGSHTFSETFEEHLAAVQKAREDGVLP